MTNPMQNGGPSEPEEEFFEDSGEALDAAEETAAAPAAPAAAAAPAAGGGRTYTVKAGDSLSKIAQALTGDLKNWKSLYEANRDQIKDPNVIRPGQVLRIP
jgi:nucleoid-associated protein YgaU